MWPIFMKLCIKIFVINLYFLIDDTVDYETYIQYFEIKLTESILTLQFGKEHEIGHNHQNYSMYS